MSEYFLDNDTSISTAIFDQQDTQDIRKHISNKKPQLETIILCDYDDIIFGRVYDVERVFSENKFL